MISLDLSSDPRRTRPDRQGPDRKAGRKAEEYFGLHWSLPSYLVDESPPAGATHFELLRDRATNAFVIRIRYISQPPDQMRRGAALDLANPPEIAVVKIDGCKAREDGTLKRINIGGTWLAAESDRLGSHQRGIVLVSQIRTKSRQRCVRSARSAPLRDTCGHIQRLPSSRI